MYLELEKQIQEKDAKPEDIYFEGLEAMRKTYKTNHSILEIDREFVIQD